MTETVIKGMFEKIRNISLNESLQFFMLCIVVHCPVEKKTHQNILFTHNFTKR